VSDKKSGYIYLAVRKIPVIILALVLTSLVLSLISPRTASAIPAPEYVWKKCPQGQLQVECRYSTDVPFGPRKWDCQRYENDPNYILLVAGGRNFTGVAKYCLQSPPSSSRLEHYLIYYPKRILPLLAWTLALKLPIYVLFRVRSKAALINILIANFVTVSVVYHFLAVTTLTGWYPVILAEVFIAPFEAVFLKLRLKQFRWEKIALATVFANLTSTLIGLFLTQCNFP